MMTAIEGMHGGLNALAETLQVKTFIKLNLLLLSEKRNQLLVRLKD